ncbi:formylglycine-generating enzyme family protein, partial [Nodularia spumigena CS-591/12]
SWYDAFEFCKRLSQRTGRDYRLPSEAEWEYACRAGTVTHFHFGDIITSEVANYDGNYTYGNSPKGQSRQETTPVGSFPPNAFGLYDMHGNLWEWCLDTWQSNYEGAPRDGSAWIDNDNQSRRLLRCGSWYYNPCSVVLPIDSTSAQTSRTTLSVFGLCVVVRLRGLFSPLHSSPLIFALVPLCPFLA